MDDIGMFTALRPAPPESTGHIRQRARARLDEALMFAPARRRPPWRKRRPVLLAAAAVTAAASAAIAIPAVLPGGPSGRFATSAWAVTQPSPGTVKVTFTKIFHDQARLQHALRADGVPAYVRSLRRCGWKPQGGYQEIVRHSTAMSFQGAHGITTIVIRPALIPKGGAVFLGGYNAPQARPGSRKSALNDVPGFQAYVMTSNQPPLCDDRARPRPAPDH